MHSVTIIWTVLLISATLALIGLALPRDVRTGRQVADWLAEGKRQRREQEQRREAAAAEQHRYADEVAVAVQGALLTAQRWHDECENAQEQVAATWAALQQADAALARARRAAAFPVRDHVEPIECERALRRAAQAAYRRGDLSDTQLLDALTGRHGWDPKLHPVEQELMIARAAVRHRGEEHRLALDAEADAWRAAGVANASAAALRHELLTARFRPAPVATPDDLQDTVVIRRPATA